ncbi:putative transmembrane protein [Senna tora]|uniref:Putative transmembrane protein n=1 Tax=Senna tora TaxID=362788 RepID=A0A834T7W8_9FABA|nr:putative transmembrane protein [Senna tora]
MGWKNKGKWWAIHIQLKNRPALQNKLAAICNSISWTSLTLKLIPLFALSANLLVSHPRDALFPYSTESLIVNVVGIWKSYSFVLLVIGISSITYSGLFPNSGLSLYSNCMPLSALGTWVFSVAGALLAIPVGIKRKSLAPLVFFGTTGTMLDIIMGISACEREHAERQMKLLEAQSAAAETQTDSDS